MGPKSVQLAKLQAFILALKDALDNNRSFLGSFTDIWALANDLTFWFNQ